MLVDAEATWCHWCHVMEAKIYGDPEVAGLINGAFVAVKADIDRARPFNPELSFPVLAEPAAFLCGKGTCSAPLRTPEALLREARRRL